MRGQILDGLKWDIVGKLINQFVGFFITIVLARLILPEEFALLAMITAFSSFVNGFVNFGFSSAIIQKKSVSSEELSSVFVINILLGILITITFYFSASFIARFYQHYELKSIAQVLSTTFVISSFGLLPWALMEKRFQFKLRMQVSVLSAVISGSLGVALAVKGYGVWSLVYQTVVNEFCRSFLSFILVKFRPKPVLNFHCLGGLSKIGLPIMLSGLMGSIFLRLDYLLIGKFFPSSILGLLFRAKSFRELIVRFSSESVGRVLFPVFSEKQNDRVWISNTALKSITMLIILVSTVTALLLVVDFELFYFLFGKKWFGAVRYFRLLLLSSITYPVVTVCTNVLIGLGKTKRFLIIDVVEKSGLVLGLVLAVHSRNIIYYLIVDLVTRYVVATIYLLRLEGVIDLKIGRILIVIIPYVVALVSFVTLVKLFSMGLDSKMFSTMMLKLSALCICLLLYWKIEMRFNHSSNFRELGKLAAGMFSRNSIKLFN